MLFHNTGGHLEYTISAIIIRSWVIPTKLLYGSSVSASNGNYQSTKH